MANESVLVPLWISLISADFSHNDIAVIDESIVSIVNYLLNNTCSLHIDP